MNKYETIIKIIILIFIRVLPVLIPQSVNPQLALDQYLIVQNTIQEMFDHIDRCLMMMMMMIMVMMMMMMMLMMMMMNRWIPYSKTCTSHHRRHHHLQHHIVNCRHQRSKLRLDGELPKAIDCYRLKYQASFIPVCLCLCKYQTC